MSVQMSGNAEGFGFHSLGSGAGATHGGSPGATAVGVSPHPGIGSSMNYVQGLQHESRNATFKQGQQEGKSSGMPSKGSSSESEGESTAAGEGDAAASGAAEDAGMGIAEDAAMIAV